MPGPWAERPKGALGSTGADGSLWENDGQCLCQPVNGSTNQSMDRPTDPLIELIDQFDQTINQASDQSSNQATNQPTNQPTNLSSNQSINQPIYQPTNLSSNHSYLIISANGCWLWWCGCFVSQNGLLEESKVEMLQVRWLVSFPWESKGPNHLNATPFPGNKALLTVY